MNDYIGIKLVKAEPMYRKEAYLNGYHRLSKDENPDKLVDDYGYHVLYSDGYHSWSPASVFEESYKAVDDLNVTAMDMLSNDYTKRFIAEYNQLRIRYTRLKRMCDIWDNQGVEGLGFTPISPRDVYKAQLKVMLDFLTVIKHRAAIENISLDS